MARKDSILLFVPGIIGLIIIISIFLLDIQLANFQKAYFIEVADETRRNNFFLVQACRELLESNQPEKIRRLFRSRGPNPVIVRLIARGLGPVIETENVPDYLSSHLRSPEIRNMFRENRREDVLVKFDEALGAFMIYHSAHFRAGGRDYLLLMASKCNSMTLLMRQTRQGILILTILGILSTLALIAYFCYWIRSPLNRLFASMSKIAAGELEYPIYVPKAGLVREIAICLQSLTEQLRRQILSLRDGASEREAILNALTEAVLLVKPEGRVEQWNRTALELFFPGIDPENSGDLVCPQELLHCVREAVSSGFRSEELSLKRGDREYQLLAHAVTFSRNGECCCLISVTDLTDIRKLETYRTEFIAAISHEMKTPLTGIVGAVDAINGGALENPEYKVRCIETLTVQSERLHALLQNFLTLTSLERQRVGSDADFLPIRPIAIIRSAVEVGKPAADAAGISIEIGACVEQEFAGDAFLLQQALNNLIQNAILHSGAKRIVVSAVETADRCIDFSVYDDGCGIAPEHLERIFKRFYRVPSPQRKRYGSGIGLAIVKHIALYHRGHVAAESQSGKGAVFHIVIPFDLPDDKGCLSGVNQ